MGDGVGELVSVAGAAVGTVEVAPVVAAAVAAVVAALVGNSPPSGPRRQAARTTNNDKSMNTDRPLRDMLASLSRLTTNIGLLRSKHFRAFLKNGDQSPNYKR